VREALRLVEGEGLVTILPQRGAQVTVLSAQEVQDVFEIRANLMASPVPDWRRRHRPRSMPDWAIC